MDLSAFDFPALLLGAAAAALITVVTGYAARTPGWRRLLIAAGILTVVLGAIAWLDLRREQPRETHVATVIVGTLLPSFGAIVIQRAGRRLRQWLRWTLVFVTAFCLLFAGLLIGAAFVPRFL